MLVLPYIFDGPEVVAVVASTWAAGTAFSGILLLSLFHFYRNLNSKCVMRWDTEYFNLNNWARYVNKMNK